MTHPKDPQAELRSLIERVRRGEAIDGTAHNTEELTDLAVVAFEKIFQAHQQELLTELLEHIEYYDYYGKEVAVVPVSVIERKIGELNG